MPATAPAWACGSPCSGERAFQGGWRPPAGTGPLVLVSLGTGYNRRPDIFRACVEAFADLPWRMVLAVGDHVRADDLGPVPPHAEVHPWVPPPAVLRHAQLFVTHAGMGSVMESLQHGVPMVALPQMAEQRANADRLVELGLGRHVDPDGATASRLRQAALDVLADAGVRTAVDRMRHRLDAAGGAPAAADVIEAALGRA